MRSGATTAVPLDAIINGLASTTYVDNGLALKVDKDLSNDTTYPPQSASTVLDNDGTPKKMTLTEIYAGANTASGAFVSSGDYSGDGLDAYTAAELKYHALTLSTLGNFKCNIKTQETGLLLYVKFP